MSVWHELIIEGTDKVVRSFVAGFAVGRDLPGVAVFGSDCGLDDTSFGERLKALFAGGSHHVLLAPAELAAPLTEAVIRHGSAVEVGLVRQRAVEALAFDIEIETFSRVLAEEIRRDLLAAPPAGVRIDGLKEHEETHPEAHGPELYSPMHEYIFRASGRFVGEPAGILFIRARAAARDFVTVGPMHIERSPGSS